MKIWTFVVLWAVLSIISPVFLTGCECSTTEITNTSKMDNPYSYDQYEEILIDGTYLHKITLYCPSEKPKVYFAKNSSISHDYRKIYFRVLQTGQRIISTCNYLDERVFQKKVNPVGNSNEDFLSKFNSSNPAAGESKTPQEAIKEKIEDSTAKNGQVINNIHIGTQSNN